MAITRGQMRRQLYGVGSLVGREKFGLGSKLKRFVRKVIPNEVADVAVKAAPFVAPFNPLLGGAMAGLGTFDQTGSISRSVKSGLINYGLGQGARYIGGADLQTGYNPFSGMEGMKYGFSSPIGQERGIGKFFGDKTTSPQTFDQQYSGIEEVLYDTAPDQLSTAQKAGIAFDKNVAKTATPGFKESVSKLFSGDLTQVGEGLKEIGGKTLKTIYTDKEGNIDKLAVGATIAGAVNYAEARKLAKEADLVTDEDEYTEEMYEADKQAYLDKYSKILTPAAFGLKDGGRANFKDGLSKNRVAQLLDLLEGTTDPDDRKMIQDEIDMLTGKYKSGGRVKFLEGGDTEYNALVYRMYVEAGGQEGTGMDIDTFAEKYFPKMAKGGRIGLESGSTPGGIPSIKLKEKDEDGFMFITKEEGAKLNPTLFADTTTYNPIPENAPNMAAADIAKIIMGTRGMPLEDGEDTGTMSSTEFIYNEYVMPKRKEMMENFGLSLKEADDLIRQELDKYKKANGGRIGYAFGTDKEGIGSLKEELDESTINRPDDAKEKLDELDGLMAGGITFSRAEKSYLFRKLGGAGGSSRSYTMPQLYGILNNPNSPGNINDAKVLKEIAIIGLGGSGKKDGGRIGYKMGSEVPVRKNAGGITELDYRNTGGFVPIGVKERADDVPAMLSKNEFVFTADAVRNAGGGDVNKGAQKMYNLMKSLENKVVV